MAENVRLSDFPFSCSAHSFCLWYFRAIGTMYLTFRLCCSGWICGQAVSHFWYYVCVYFLFCRFRLFLFDRFRLFFSVSLFRNCHSIRRTNIAILFSMSMIGCRMDMGWDCHVRIDRQHIVFWPNTTGVGVTLAPPQADRVRKPWHWHF